MERSRRPPIFLASVMVAAAMAAHGAPAPTGAQPCADYTAATLWLDQQWACMYERGLPSKALLVQGNTLMAAGTIGLTLAFLDASDPRDLHRVTYTWDWRRDGYGGDVRDIAVKGDFLYLCTRDTLCTVSIVDPTQRIYTSTIGGLGRQAALACEGDLLLLAGEVLRVFDVSQADTPAWRGALDLGGPVLDVALRDGVAYAVTASGLTTVDVSVPASPRVLGCYDNGEMGEYGAVALDGCHAYLASVDLQVLNVADPAAPTLVASVPGAGGHAIAVGEGYAVVASQSDCIVCDVVDPARPRLLQRLTQAPHGFTGGVAIKGGCLYAVAHGAYSGEWGSSGAVVSQRLSRAAPPSPLAQLSWPDLWEGPYWLGASGSHVRFACPAPNHPGYYALRTADLGDPARPIPRGGTDVRGYRFMTAGNFVYAASGRLEAVDMSDPDSPRVVASVPLTAEPDFYWNRSMAQIGDLLVANLEGLGGRAHVDPIVDISDPAQPQVIGCLPDWLAGRRFVAAHGLAYTLSGPNLLVVDLNDPLAPRLITTVGLDQNSPWDELVEAGGNLYYTIIDSGADDSYQLCTIDLADPAAPRPANRLQIPGNGTDLAGGDKSLLLTGPFGGNHLIDVSRANAPRYGGAVAFTGGPQVVCGNALILPAAGGITVYPRPCAQAVPTLLAFFTAQPADGAVHLSWATSAAGGGEFRLTAHANDATWPVDFTRAAELFTARDASPRLAAGGSITYVIETRDGDSGAWTELAREDVVLSGPSRPVALLPPRPNPFNPVVRIAFVLEQAQAVTLAVYDLAGRRVATLANGPLPAGRQELIWRGTGDDGSPAASGSYLLRIDGERGRDQRRVSLVR